LYLALAAMGCLAVGALMGLTLNPIVKRIWTPSWTVFSTGWVVLFLAGYYYVVDVRQSRGWTLPFLVIGANSIAMYVLVHVAVDYMERAFLTHLGRAPFEIFDAVFAPALLGLATLAVFWGILYWMYRNRVLVRI